MSENKSNWTEIAIMWPGKESVARGVVCTACPVLLSPGDTIVVTKIKSDAKSEKAPDFKVSIVRELERKADQGGNGSGF